MPQMTSGHINTYSFPNSGHCRIHCLLPLRAGLFTFQLLRDSSADSNLSAASTAKTTSSQSHWQAPAACWQRAGSQPLDKQRRSAAKCCLPGHSGSRNLDQPSHFNARVCCYYRNTPRHIRTHLLCALSNRWDVSYSQSILRWSDVNHSMLAAHCSQLSCSPRVHPQSVSATPYLLYSFLYLGDLHVHHSKAKHGKGKKISRQVLSS